MNGDNQINGGDQTNEVINDFEGENEGTIDEEEEDTIEEEETTVEEEEEENEENDETARGGLTVPMTTPMTVIQPLGELPPIIITNPQPSPPIPVAEIIPLPSPVPATEIIPLPSSTLIPPPIPAALIQPAPVQLVIPAKVTPTPTVTIQPTDPTQITTLIATGKPLPPSTAGVQPTVVLTQPVTRGIQPGVQAPVIQKVITLDSLLIKRDSETEEFFNMRSAYSKAAMNVFQSKINPATAVLIGQMATDKAMYGIVYPEESDRVVRYVNAQIMKQ